MPRARAVHRQAARFSRGPRGALPRRSARKAGAADGVWAHRRVPREIDEIYDATPLAQCSHCAGAVQPIRIATQYKEDLPVQRPTVRAFQVHIGRCTRCRRRVHGRHPLQTSDALSAGSI